MLNEIDIETSAALFNAIWKRKPIIFILKNKERLEYVLETLFSFIPMYRQLIICGLLSKKYYYEKKPAKNLPTNDLNTVIETLEACFKEDGIISSPIQLIYLDALKEDFQKVLRNIEYGWVATTFLEESLVKSLFSLSNPVPIALSQDVTVLMLEPGTDRDDMTLEKQIIRRCLNKTTTVTRFMLQMKMSEVNFICMAFLDQIEKGLAINQVEAEEQFEIDTQMFLRVLDILKTEFHIEPEQYIEYISEPISRFLKQVIRFQGVNAVIVIKNGKIVGLEKRHYIFPYTTGIFTPFINLLEQSKKDEFWGDEISLIINMQNDLKLLFCSKFFPAENDYIYIAAFLEPKVQIALFMSEMEDIIKLQSEPRQTC